MTERKYRIILSGGGTGGHIYPAVAVAEALGDKLGSRAEILFVGAEGRMEMEKIPALGYRIAGLPVAGLQRKLSLSNLTLPFKVARSLRKARRLIRDFEANVVAGFGGYASAPVIWTAQRMGIPTLIQEQNSYAGITNKLLGKRADRICVAYDDMQRFFPAGKITLTGNPLRCTFGSKDIKKEDALGYFGLSGDRPVVLVLGGSLGTRTLNNMMKRRADEIMSKKDFQVIWQTGKLYREEVQAFMESRSGECIWHGAFIDRMDYAYTAADIVISRSGANTVSELCLMGKPTVFVPSPNVAEDHQTKNAESLAVKGAAIVVPDASAVDEAIPAAVELLGDAGRMKELGANMLKLATPGSARLIADMIIELAEKR